MAITELATESVTGQLRVHYRSDNQAFPGYFRVRLTEKCSSRIVMDVWEFNSAGQELGSRTVEITKANPRQYARAKERFERLQAIAKCATAKGAISG